MAIGLAVFATRSRADDPPHADPGSAEHHEDGSATPTTPADHHEGSAVEEHHEGSAAEHHEGSGSAEEHHDGSGSGSAEEHHDGSGSGSGSAEDHHEGSGSADDHHEGSAAPAMEHHATVGDADGDGIPDATEDKDHDGVPDSKEDSDGDGVSDMDEQVMEADVDVNAPDADGDGVPDAQEDGDIDNDGVPDAEQEDPPTSPFDEDGDGKMSPEEIADRKEFGEFFDDIPNQPDAKALESRPNDSELKPSISVDMFRKGVRLVKKIVLAKMEKKIAKSSDKKMKKISLIISGVSLLGLLLLFMPLVLAKKYPGQGKNLVKYSALAAVTFVVTVNLFGGVLYGLRVVQGALSSYTNPSIAIAAGTFDALDDNAEHFLSTGKELFMPTVEQIRNSPDEQPSVALLGNGLKIVKDAKVFLSIAKMFKKVDFVFKVLPIILTFVALLLFVLAIRPTLTEIIKLPARAASGEAGVGREVVANSMRRVKGELIASLGTIGVLVVLTVVSGLVLSQVVKPALFAFLDYFSLTVQYLQFAEGASSGLVFMTLFSVILFLVFNLATLILSTAFFLGKSQKIFQQRFNEGTPLSTHARFFKWGTPSVLLVQVFPLIFILIAGKALAAIENSVKGTELNAESISWGKMLMAGPGFLVVGFVVLFWAVRGMKALKFLATYKVKPKAPKAAKAPEAA
ncbi:MAG: hypothetical protein IPQ07_14685 [Myxococcales bacterium]|nr:hypothetical protein [Myxococcales bacterium]